MDYEERIDRLKEHIAEHPTDYQAVIGLLKARSDAIDHMIYESRIDKARKVAKYRREYNEEHSFK